jgi:hypothetical protein
MNPSQLFSFILDILLIAAAVLAYLARPRIGGQLAKGLRILLIGVMILGLVHFLESGLFFLFSNWPVGVHEVIHRLLVVGGFGFVIFGFVMMRRAFEE